jgi:hypothetical protein
MFVTCKVLQPSLMFGGKAGAYSAPERSPPWDRILALPTNIRLGWKGLPVTNPRSLLRAFVNYGRKKFYNIGPW